ASTNAVSNVTDVADMTKVTSVTNVTSATGAGAPLSAAAPSISGALVAPRTAAGAASDDRSREAAH
ncbi:hypothetical protein, partial [Streptomyces tsukubensis]